jgi:hypothetical protein
MMSKCPELCDLTPMGTCCTDVPYVVRLSSLHGLPDLAYNLVAVIAVREIISETDKQRRYLKGSYAYTCLVSPCII